MTKSVIMALLGGASCAAAAARPAPIAMRSTSKTADQFLGCFIAAQQRASLPWWFVPKADGGTASNLGARNVRNAYFVAISDRGSSREVRLEQASAGSPADRAVSQAVDRCI